MKILVLYYSLNGNTRFIANRIAEAIGAETLEIRPLKDIKSTGFMRYM